MDLHHLHRPHPLARGLVVAAGVVVVQTLASVVALAADVWGQLPAGLLLVLLVAELTGVLLWVRSRQRRSEPAATAAPDPVDPSPSTRPHLTLVESVSSAT